MARLWQYQSRAEPVIDPVKLSHWHSATEVPARKKRSALVIGGSTTEPLFGIAAPVISIDQWYAPTSLPICKQRAAIQLCSVLVEFSLPVAPDVPVEVLHTSWLQPIHARRFNAALYGRGVNCFDANGILNPVYDAVVSIPRTPLPVLRRRKPLESIVILDPLPVPNAPDVVTVDKWFRETIGPRWTRRQPVEIPTYVDPPKTVTIDKWYEPTSEPKRRQRRAVEFSGSVLVDFSVPTPPAIPDLSTWEPQGLHNPRSRPKAQHASMAASPTLIHGIFLAPGIFDPDVVDEWTIPGGGKEWTIPEHA